MRIRRRLATLVAASVAAVAIPLAPGLVQSATAGSCTSASGFSDVLPGSLASVSGYVSVGLDTSYMTISNTTTDVLTCGGKVPSLGERFYVRVMTTDVQGGGSPSLFTHGVRLPAGVYPAIDANNPVVCFVQRLSDNATDAAQTCPSPASVPSLDALTGGGWNQAFPYYTSTTYALGQTQLPAGWSFVTAIPVVATKPFAGLGGASSSFLWGGVEVNWIGTGGTAFAYSKLPFLVNDRSPVVTYPGTPVTSIGTTTATLQARVDNFWKAGTAWMEYGATAGYGQVTSSESIPGDDPMFAAYLTDLHPVSGLVPGTTYHWRAVFRTSTGAQYYGADRTFTTGGTKPSDSVAPTVSVTGPTGAFRTSTALKATYAATDASGVASYSVRWARATAGGGTLSAWTYPAAWTGTSAKSVSLTGTPGYRYCFSVNAKDAVGNVSTWSAPRCTVIPVDDRGLTASTGWTRGTSSGWIAGTSTYGSKSGATLTRTSGGVYQVGVIATTCATCGALAVYVAGVKVGTISLVSSSTVPRALKVLPRFSAKKTGSVKLVVTSATGKLVKIDALATTAW